MTASPPIPRDRLPRGVFLIAVLLTPFLASAAPDDAPVTSLTARARANVDFDRDIRPIFQASCFRCHSGEKPRSHFRLDDRDAALKGGKDGVDILPGRAADSPLIARVSTTNEDLLMPPPGRGDSLTAAQVKTLRDWIDQGADFGSTNSHPSVTAEVSAEFGGLRIHGDRAKFREIEGVNDGFSGGGHFTLEDQLKPDEKFEADGRFLSAGQDYTLHLSVAKTDLGFIRAGFERWREYSDNLGGFDPAATPPGLSSQGSLYLDEGRAWVDLGLTLPRGPQVTLGYEQQFRQGAEDTLDWGPLNGRNLAPSYQSVDERTHIIKLDVSGEIAGWQIDDSGRVEIHRQANIDHEITGPSVQLQTLDKYRSVEGADTLHIEKSLRDWWLLSAGYSYSRLEAGDSLVQTGVPVAAQYWEAPQLTLSSESHIFSLSSLFHAGSDLSLGLDLQNEWTHQEGFGNVENTFGLLAIPIVSPPIVENANYDEFRSLQNATLRFTRIPWTVLFADGRFEQDADRQFEQGSIDGPSNPFSDQIDAGNSEYDGRAGFTTSPLPWISLTAQYRFYASDTSYNHLADSTPLLGYPAFITGRTIETHKAEAKLALHPASWVRATLSYTVERTDFASSTDPVAFGVTPGGALLDGRYRAHTYALNLALNPFSRLSFSGNFTYGDSRTDTFDNNDPAVVPYRGGLYMISGGASYQIDATTTFNASYSFAQSSYGQDNGVAGIPMGLDYTRHSAAATLAKQFNKSLSGALRYVFYTYAEPTDGGLDNYTAHGLFASMTWRAP